MQRIDINMPAVRAFMRAIRPVNAAYDKAVELDRKFDGGEWSDAASSHALDDEEERIAAIVAFRFGLNTEVLMDMATFIGNHQHECFMTHVFANKPKRATT